MGGGVLFVVCVPTANFEHVLLHGHPKKSKWSEKDKSKENILKAEIELRNKGVPKTLKASGRKASSGAVLRNSVEDDVIPMEKILDELLTKLEIEHVVWCPDKNGNYYEVLFPVPAGDPCETALHCLTELGIGIKLNSIVSCLAALGLVENNASNIVAAMLVSPLMGPVMSLTFGTIIADRRLQFGGFKSLFIGIFISALFGLIFGLILGTTEMPWGFGDFPTEEMKGRGNVRSLWMGVLWALPSGTGVALALLQGSAGPLIGVAISASLLPPIVNGGLFWALACIYLLYPESKIPHLKGEQYFGNSSYIPIYVEYIPVEFLINGIVSCCLTFVNVICIFITAIIVLKIKEVAAPYTSTPDLRRFWEHDIRMVRETNRSTLQQAEEEERKEYMQNLNKKTQEDVDTVYQAAVKEVLNDDTFRKIQRVSYSVHGPEEVHRQLEARDSINSFQSGHRSNRNSALTDLAALDKLITSLLGTQPNPSSMSHLSPVTRSSLRGSKRGRNSQNSSPLPTILETHRKEKGNARDDSPSTSFRGLFQNVSQLPHRFSMTNHGSEEMSSLTKNNV